MKKDIPASIEAREFVLVNSQGAIAAKIGTTSRSHWPYFEMFDVDGSRRISISIEDGTPTVAVLNDDGNSYSVRMMKGEGHTGVVVFNEQGEQVAELGIDKIGPVRPTPGGDDDSA